MKNPPTHAMIAEACGVSVSTVSRALNENPEIPETTRRKIRAKAEEMGWKVNPLVSAYMAHLRSGRKIKYQANLAYVIPVTHVRKIEELFGYHQEHFNGAREHATASGYGLEPIWYHEWNGHGEKLSRMLKSRGIPGLILYGPSVTRACYENLDWPSFAAATWGAASPDYKIYLSAAHHHLDMQLAIERIRSYGYRKLALMLFESQDEISQHGLYAAFLYQKAFDPSPLNYEYLKLSEANTTAFRMKSARQWLEKHQPEVIIGEQIVWDTLREMGWEVPAKVSFVSMCWDPGWAHIAGIDQQAAEIGRNTVDLVVDQLIRNKRGLPQNPKLILNEGVWMDGPSCPDRTRTEAAGGKVKTRRKEM